MNKKLALKTQVKFLGRFVPLIENGLSIIDALDIMATFIDVKIINTMKENCLDGLPFSDTLEALGFDARTIYIVRANEQHHSLLRGLQGAKKYSENYFESKQDLSKKLRYPMFLFGLVMLVLMVVFIFFVPRLEDFHQTFGIEEGGFGITGIILVLGLLFGLFFIVTTLMLLVFNWRHPGFQEKVRRQVFRMHGLRKLSTRLFSYYFATQIEMFISSGLSFKQSIETIKQFEKVPLVVLIIDEIIARLEEGQAVGDVIKTSDAFSAYFKLISAHALKIGKLDVELNAFTKAELEHLNKLMTTVIKGVQGCFLGLIGVLIIMLYLSILQPVFELIHMI